MKSVGVKRRKTPGEKNIPLGSPCSQGALLTYPRGREQIGNIEKAEDVEKYLVGELGNGGSGLRHGGWCSEMNPN